MEEKIGIICPIDHKCYKTEVLYKPKGKPFLRHCKRTIKKSGKDWVIAIFPKEEWKKLKEYVFSDFEKSDKLIAVEYDEPFAFFIHFWGKEKVITRTVMRIQAYFSGSGDYHLIDKRGVI